MAGPSRDAPSPGAHANTHMHAPSSGVRCRRLRYQAVGDWLLDPAPGQGRRLSTHPASDDHEHIHGPGLARRLGNKLVCMRARAIVRCVHARMRRARTLTGRAAGWGTCATCATPIKCMPEQRPVLLLGRLPQALLIAASSRHVYKLAPLCAQPRRHVHDGNQPSGEWASIARQGARGTGACDESGHTLRG